MISVVRAGPKQPPNPLANPFVIPSGATEEEVETYWRPLVCDLHALWLEPGTVMADHVTMRNGELRPSAISVPKDMATVTGIKVRAELRRQLERHATRAGVVLALSCSAECMSGKRCHRSNLVPWAKEIVTELNASRSAPCLERPLLSEGRPPTEPWQRLPTRPSPEQAMAQAWIIAEGIIWMGLNAKQAASLLSAGRVCPKGGANASLTPAQAVKSTRGDDPCTRRATAPRRCATPRRERRRAGCWS